MGIGKYINPWVSMTVAILGELSGTITAKASEGITHPRQALGMYASYAVSVSFLALALDPTTTGGLDLGVAYATWSGLGTVVAAVAGVLVFGETLSVSQLVGMVVTIVGVMMVNVTFDGTITGEYNLDKVGEEEMAVSESSPLLVANGKS